MFQVSKMIKKYTSASFTKTKPKHQIAERPINSAFYISEKHSNGFASLKLNVVPFVKWYLHTYTASLNTEWAKMSAVFTQSKLKCQGAMRDGKCYYISEEGKYFFRGLVRRLITLFCYNVQTLALASTLRGSAQVFSQTICTCLFHTSVAVNLEDNKISNGNFYCSN